MELSQPPLESILSFRFIILIILSSQVLTDGSDEVYGNAQLPLVYFFKCQVLFLP